MIIRTLRHWLREPARSRRVRRLSVRRPSVQLRLEPCEARITPNAGALDPTFGAAGRVTTNFVGMFSGFDEAQSVVIQPDQKIVVAGFSDAGGNNDFALARYNPDGTLDATFGTGGL